MKVTGLLKTAAILGIIFLLVFLVILFWVDPLLAGKTSLIYFLSVLFLALACLLTLPGYYLRTIFSREKSPNANFSIAIRQSILISIAIVGLLILKAMESLSWWDGLLLIAALVFLEMFFRS